MSHLEGPSTPLEPQDAPTHVSDLGQEPLTVGNDILALQLRCQCHKHMQVPHCVSTRRPTMNDKPQMSLKCKTRTCIRSSMAVCRRLISSMSKRGWQSQSFRHARPMRDLSSCTWSTPELYRPCAGPPTHFVLSNTPNRLNPSLDL